LRLIPTRARAGRTSTDATGPVVATGCTAIETLARCSPLAAVTVALPGAMPVSDPSMDTDATAESLLDHAMLAPPTTAPAASLARALSWARSPTRTLAGAPTVSTAATDPYVGERSSRYAPTPPTATSAAAHGSARLTPGERLAPGSRRKLILLTGIGLLGVFGKARTSWPRLANSARLRRTGSSGATARKPIAATAASSDGHRWLASFWSMRMTASASAAGQSGRSSLNGCGASN